MSTARKAPQSAPADAALDALAAALAPRVARLIRARASEDGDTELAKLLESAGYEIAPEDGSS